MSAQTPAVTKRRGALKGSRNGTLPLHLGPKRWALVADGTLALLGTDLVIPKDDTRALIEFLRRLDEGQA